MSATRANANIGATNASRRDFDIDHLHGCHHFPFDRMAIQRHVPSTWRRIAPSNSSRVNGLVRYCSEPTMRPRALSNKPSLEDSMITGVLLNIWLFLISAQV